MNEEIKNYIQIEKSKGVSDEQIKTILMNQGGWSANELDVYFNQTSLNTTDSQVLSMPQKVHTDNSINLYSEIKQNKKAVVNFFIWIIVLNVFIGTDALHTIISSYGSSLSSLTKKIFFLVPMVTILGYLSIVLIKKIIKTFQLQSLLVNEINSQEKLIARKRIFITGFLCVTFTLFILRMIVFVFNQLAK